MSDACTIYSMTRNYEQVVDALRKETASVEVTGPANRWTSIRVAGRHGASLTFTSMEQLAPGDQFSQIILATHNEFRLVRIKFRLLRRKAARVQDDVLLFVARTDLMIGVVAETSFGADDSFLACVDAATRSVDGLIFNGSAMVNADGVLYLDFEGRTQK